MSHVLDTHTWIEGCLPVMGNATSRPELSLCPELMTEILSRVPDRDVIFTCRLVCKQWKSLIDDNTLWKLKAIRRGCVIPKICSLNGSMPHHFYRSIAIKNPFGRNLVKNPCGKQGFKYWRISQSGGDGWRVENPPTGADPLDSFEELKGYTSCFATSYGPCEKEQRIDLISEGCSEEILKLTKPKIYICDWYCARFDCGSKYRLHVELLTKDKEVIGKPFSFEYEEIQWAGREWRKVEHTFSDTESVRFVVFRHGGKDTQYWAGFYGSKVTGSTVRLLL